MEARQHYLEEELYRRVRDEHEIFDFLQAGSLDGVWFWNLENPEEEWMSPRFWETFGYEPEEKQHLASEWQDMIHPDDLAVAIDNFNKHCADSSHPYDQVVRYRHKKGHTVWVRCRGLLIRDEAGKPVRMLGAHVDVTDLKNAEIALEEANKDLMRSNRDLEQFAFTASHDLREPLRKIIMLGGILENEVGEQLTDRGRKALGFMDDAAKRMDALLKSLLSYARIATRCETFSEVVLTELVEKSQLDLGVLLKASGGRVEVSASLVLWGDVPQLGQLFQNLIHNSLKYTSEAPPFVELDGWMEGDQCVVVCRDNGMGFPQEKATKIFDPFVRLVNKADYPGTGLGLATCKKIVERHGGSITARSTPGEGAVFEVRLPKKTEDEDG